MKSLVSCKGNHAACVKETAPQADATKALISDQAGGGSQKRGINNQQMRSAP